MLETLFYNLPEKMRKLLLLIIAFWVTIYAAKGQNMESIKGNHSGVVQKEVQIQYLVSLPEAYDEKSREVWPLLVFLHGSGERGDNLDLVKVHGPLKHVDQGQNFNFIILAPQCPVNEDFDSETLFSLISQIAEMYKVDKDRIYVTGLSMGGAATWDLAMLHPEYFAAIAPVCGYVNRNYPFKAEALKNLPVWVFHGANDDVVPVHREANMVAALEYFGNKVKFSIYPTANHDAWTETYKNPELYEWLLKQRRASPGK